MKSTNTSSSLPGQQLIAYFFLLSFVFYCMGCYHYKVDKTYYPKDLTPIPGEVSESGKYLILHNGSKVHSMKDIVIHEANQTIEFTPDTLSHLHYEGLDPDTTRARHFHKRNGDPTNEVHIYIQEQTIQNGEKTFISADAIKVIDVYDKAIGVNVISFVFGGLAIAMGAVIAVFIVALAVKSSCPFVYITSENKRIFAGEIYGGAIYSSLERDDFLKLDDALLQNPEIVIQIANELLERQYTNVAEILSVEHDSDEVAIMNKEGEILLSRTILTPTCADKSIEHVLSEQDSQFFSFDRSLKESPELSEIELSFPLPEKPLRASLLLHAKNSFWLDYVFGKFTEKFGTYYPTYAEKQKTVPANKNVAWSLEQHIPLAVYIRKNNAWKFVDFYHVTGPLASRDMSISIDLRDIDSDTLEVKLSCGRLFWEIDCAALMLHDTPPVKAQSLVMRSGVDENGSNIAESLLQSDNTYLQQPSIGNIATLTFENKKPAQGKCMSYFLRTRGYYEYIRDFKNKPDKFELLSFRKAGSFNRFSEELYRDFVLHPFQVASH